MFELQKKVTRCSYKCGLLLVTKVCDGDIPDYYYEILPHKPSRERWWVNEVSVVIYVPEMYGDDFDYVFENKLYLQLCDITATIENLDTSRIFIISSEDGFVFSDINGVIVYLASKSIYVPKNLSSKNPDTRTLFYQIIDLIENSDIINVELLNDDGVDYIGNMNYNPTSNPLTIAHTVNCMMDHNNGYFMFKRIDTVVRGIRVLGEKFDGLLKEYFDINGNGR